MTAIEPESPARRQRSDGARSRRAILERLSQDPCTVAELADDMPISRPAVSQHLKVLREAGWVDSERRGTWIWYRIRPEAVARMHELVGGFMPGPARRVEGTRKLSVVQPTA